MMTAELMTALGELEAKRDADLKVARDTYHGVCLSIMKAGQPTSDEAYALADTAFQVWTAREIEVNAAFEKAARHARLMLG
jgi:hypothetical protein